MGVDFADRVSVDSQDCNVSDEVDSGNLLTSHLNGALIPAASENLVLVGLSFP